jgi:murein DD-endopeptidase MepM/ murein hydrolase activator NlpD
MSKKPRKKEYSTIMIVNKNNPNTKSISIPSKHIYRLKYYIGTLVFMFLGLIAGIYFIYQEYNKNKNAQKELAFIQNEIVKPLATDTTIARDYINKIEEKIERINRYLNQRGVKHKIKPEGGVDFTNINAIESYKYYNIYLQSLIKNLKHMPLGYPHPNHHASGYGYRANPFHGSGSEFHSGIDIRGNTGDPIKATASGTVTIAGYHYGYGNCVVIRHNHGYETLYGHLSKIRVRVGQKINTNHRVGDLGSTGRSTGPHLHYEVRYLGKPLNPTKFLELQN